MTKELENTFLAGLALNKEKLFRLCSAYAHDNEAAGDLFQEVLINIWQAIPTFSGKSSLGTWMFRITLNICLRLQATQTRRKSLFVNIEKSGLENIGMAEEDDERSEQLARLRKCIRLLNEADRSIIALYLEELPYKEISEITGITENTIAVKVKRIKNKLFNCMNSGL
jgi:RNA polymerase sigma factor (sigma-70 family)